MTQPATLTARAAVAQSQIAFRRLQADPFATATDDDRAAADKLRAEIRRGGWAPRHVRNFRDALAVFDALK